jgi:cobalt/nickel transport system permease protein
MASINSELAGLHHIETIASQDTPVHRIDARAKIIVTLAFVVTVMSFGPYRLNPLIPFLIFPFVMISAGGIPLRDLLVRVFIAMPFVIMIGIFNPLIDRTPVTIAGVTVAAGWISFLSIVARSLLTVTAAMAILYTTGMYRLCRGLEQLGVPGIIVIQLLFTYRYLFVLANEAGRMLRARQLRGLAGKRLSIREFGRLAGALFTKTLDRAERIHVAMLSRGFSGEIHLARGSRFSIPDILFCAGWILVFALMRWFNISALAGKLAERIIL